MKKKKVIELRTLIIIILFLWIISAFISWFIFKDWKESASFGDTFGGINSLFSGLALAGIIYTIFLQKTELSLQRKELKYTREELKRTAIAQEDSAKSMTMQIRLTNFPYLEFDSEINNDEKCITIKNRTNNVAFDIAISIFCFIPEDEYPFSKYIEKNISESYKKRALGISLLDDHLWSISDVGYYPSISKNKKIIIPLKFPIDFGVYSMFVQYKDVLGNNYSNLINFNSFQDYETIDDKPFSGIRIRPEFPVITDRINPNDKKKTGDNVPKFINEFIKIDKSSIGLGLLKNAKFISNDFKWKVELHSS